jgi:hypothetical protein
MIQRVADLSPPLGKPGGPCQVVNRIEDKIPNEQLRQDLIQDVQKGQDLSNQEASKIYRVNREPGVGAIEEIEITSHGQYRMDLRKITVDDVRRGLGSFLDHLDRLKALNPKGLENTLRGLNGGEKMVWINPRTKLVVVFQKSGPSKVTMVTSYWKGRPDPGSGVVCDR